MKVSALKVMRSNAGFYLGRTEYDEEFQVDLPYSRESGYYRNKEEAERELRERQS